MVINVNTQLPGGVGTINEAYFDALVRHQVGLLRLTGSVKKDVIKLLDATEQDIADKIRVRLANHKGLSTPRDVQRLQSLLKSIKATRLTAWKQVDALWVKEMRELAKSEPAFASGALKTVVPVTLETVLPSNELLRSIVSTRPFEGKTLKQWSRSVSAADVRRIEDQIKIGMVQGESSDAIARRVVGTAKLRGRNGVTEITRRQAAGVTRTAVIAISNQAKREFYRANEVLFAEELYVATLDSRTSPICKSLDGERFPVSEPPYPPLHFNCRSLRTAIIKGEVIGRRPAKSSTEPGLVREFSRKEGLAQTFTRRAQLPRGQKGAFDRFKAQRVRELTGNVPAKVSYGEWLRRQSAEFQNDTLGVTKARLFRKGKLNLDRFVNRAGDEIPLSQLARTDAAAFRAAGLNPEDFL
jgi:SPP1 gp7 family putative phage head morphogenesis protein